MNGKTKKEFEEISCILCGENKTKSICEKGQHSFPTHVSICKNDGLVYLTPRWTQKRYIQFYREEYDECYRPRVFSEKECLDYEYPRYLQLWERIQQEIQLSQIQSVLDIGPGIGSTLHFLKRERGGENIQCAAIEPSAHCRQFLQEKLQIEFLADDVDDDWHLNQKGKFDLIIMRHVLEHFLDPINVLEKVAQTLSDCGVAYIALPDMMNPDLDLYTSYFRVVHTYYFCEETLLQIAEKSGLQASIIQSENGELWGVFRKSEKREPVLTPSLFEKQLTVINKYS